MMEYICSGCGRKLNLEEIVILGPDMMIWCGNGLCLGKHTFVKNAKKQQAYEMINSPDIPLEIKSYMIELWESLCGEW